MDTQPAVPPRDASIEYISDNIFQLTLTTENKDEIFAHGLSKLDESAEEADLILRNLTAWCPDIAAQFSKRSSTTILDTPFRLIFPADARESFDNGLYVRQYVAISYCWHSADYPYPGCEPYDCWPFSKPFVDAILSDKDHPREGIWIDQLCIDQEDSLDKQKSVAAMDVIYRSCIRLLVLLEDVTLDEAETRLVKDCTGIAMRYKRSWVPEPDVRHLYVSVWRKVEKARWWDRAWCYHEFCLNEPQSVMRHLDVHEATFVMNGPDGSTVKVKWLDLRLILSMGVEFLYAEQGFDLTHAKTSVILTGYVTSGEDPTTRNGEVSRPSIMARHNGVAQKGCQYFEDRVSIMLNISGLALAYNGDGSSDKEKILYVSALLALAAGEAHPLSMMDSKSIKLDGNTTWLSPSIAAQDTTIPNYILGSVQGIRHISTEFIELDMIFLRAPWGLRQQDAQLETANRVFPEMIETTEPLRHTPDGVIVSPLTVRPDSEYDERRRKFIAICIENGLEFTAALWEQLKRDVVHPNYNQGGHQDFQPNAALSVSAQKFLEQLHRNANAEIVERIAFDVEDAKLFLTWVTDPRSMYYIGYLTVRLQCTIDGRHALMTSTHINEHWEGAVFEELQAAIPVDLLGVSCIPLRIWILQPLEIKEDKVVSWRIVAKALLLGEPDLMEEVRLNGNRDDAVVKLEMGVRVGA
ncbi:hypothetical protein CUC08_Gglean000418 [Alternaria sp. MG1]|uniref:Heterokaryon incompatibility domain-containing protein n=2 Tax=Alternaria alternata complex TaxID=187734 RepID=A0A4Q4NR54_ALTAL|nr:uncharacterized protein J4E82_010887 [Alternaria postmessia]RII21256.1 hypothetical protein CUC08_Gglean000418 [Alternaria sp. MG1]RYN81193.1 hypothetical protein AA0117_g2457 [Alternaria alternata]RYO04942.1 hypothetical protein AA0119_g3418 [Alternaria tenuissima]KAI5367012.1 hypothetical protein J4E82_010887 [Alternaria postmessia]RYO16867.1 hypothetical protein AA0121_g5950 [Alternaria tenuissima]